MMKKLPVIASLTFFLTFLGLFIYSYKSFGKFRKSIASALLAAFVLLSWSEESTAKGVNGFSTLEFSRPAKRPGLFSGKSKNNGPGKPGKPDGNGGDEDDGGKPQYTAPESVQDTNERVKKIKKYVRQLEEETDSESEIETESECESVEQLQVNESYKSNSDLKKITKNAHKSKRAVKNLEDVKQKLSEGENPMKIGYKPTNLGNGFYYIRKPNARIIVEIDPTTGNSNIVAFGLRSNEKDMEKLAAVVNSQCDTKIKINPKAY
jgi:mRNA-degrading endonuclease RelE of RelBE toxin-antitoxin system